MIKITRQTIANTVAERFEDQYSDERGKKAWGSGLTRGELIDKLYELGGTPNPDDIDDLIGNDSWTCIPDCSECGKSGADFIVMVGEEPDYESNTAYLCYECIEKILRLAIEKE